MTAKYPVTPERVTMYDSVNAASLPAGTIRAAGYINGDYASHAAIVQFLRQNGWAVSGKEQAEQGRGAERRVTPALPRFNDPCPT